MLLLLPISIYILNTDLSNEKEDDIPKQNDDLDFEPLDGAWYKEEGNAKILFLNGTNYMMGYQHGYFLKKEIGQLYSIIVNVFDSLGCSYDTFMEVWEQMEKNLPNDYIEEMQGISNGSGHSLDKIYLLNTVTSVLNLYHCSGMSAWGEATKNGDLIHFRSADGPANLIDEVSGVALNELHAIFVRNPKDKFRSMSVSFIGDACSLGGFNEKGIAVGEMSCKSDDTTYDAINIAFRMRMILDHADNLDEAIEIMKNKRGCGWNNIISDAVLNKGVVVEQTANIFYVGEWDDPVESKRPFYKIEDVVRRTNFYINPETAKTQRQHYNPRGLLSLFRHLFKNDKYFIQWNHYKTLSKRINLYHGSLDVDKTMIMVREVYSGEGNIVFKYFQNKGEKQAMHQWVANPKTGDFLVSFGSLGKSAHENPVHSFNFYDLIEGKI